MERVTKLLRIEGLVQGVGFRYFMQRKARMLGVTGWVRNRTDGTVEAVVQGSADSIAAIIAQAKQGPRSARVTSVKVSDAAGQFGDFDTLRTE
jgi:acylphosphatase